MKIKEGANVKDIHTPTIKEIRINAIDNYVFELWINESLSYITLDEALKLRDELHNQVRKSITQGGNR